MYFQRYIFSKSYVLMDLEFMVLDTFDQARPGLVRFSSAAEAAEACAFLEDREARGLPVVDLLASYQRDGGGYDLEEVA
jgi:hypothetical protein